MKYLAGGVVYLMHWTTNLEMLFDALFFMKISFSVPF